MPSGRGEFRVHAALKQLGIELSPRTCGRILAVNRRLCGLGKPVSVKADPKPMPFKARRRHQYWTVDIRYLDHGVDDDAVYCISILENYSRAILASGISRKQDLTAYLIVLYAAIQQHGAPEALVSDGGGVFRAKQALQIYERLGIGCPLGDAPDRAAPAVAVLYRDVVQCAAAHGGLARRPGDHLDGPARGPRSLGG